MNSLKAWPLLLLSIVAQAGTVNLSDADKQAITQTAQNYANGWYSGNRAQMESSLHDKLAKRAYLTNKEGVRGLNEMGKEILANGTKPENKARYEGSKKLAEVEILDGFGNAATVKLQMNDWVDYMHIVRTEKNEWRIINVLWELNSK